MPNSYLLTNGGSHAAERLLLCRFPDACMTTPSARADSRRPESAKARNRGGGLRSSPRAPERVSDGEIEVHAMRAWHGS